MGLVEINGVLTALSVLVPAAEAAVPIIKNALQGTPPTEADVATLQQVAEALNAQAAALEAS